MCDSSKEVDECDKIELWLVCLPNTVDSVFPTVGEDVSFPGKLSVDRSSPKLTVRTTKHRLTQSDVKTITIHEIGGITHPESRVAWIKVTRKK